MDYPYPLCLYSSPRILDLGEPELRRIENINLWWMFEEILIGTYLMNESNQLHLEFISFEQDNLIDCDSKQLDR